MARTEAYLHAEFHRDPSNRLATVRERYRQTDRQTDRTDRQRSDSIGRTVLQTVAQKLRFIGTVKDGGLLYVLPIFSRLNDLQLFDRK